MTKIEQILSPMGQCRAYNVCDIKVLNGEERGQREEKNENKEYFKEGMQKILKSKNKKN